MALPQLQTYDLSQASLCAIDMPEQAPNQLVMALDCPVQGWRWKRLIPAPLRWLLFALDGLAYRVCLSFVDVQGLQLGGSFGQSNQRSLCGKLFQHQAPTIVQVQFQPAGNGRARAHLDFAEGTLAFEFGSCLQRQRSQPAAG